MVYAKLTASKSPDFVSTSYMGSSIPTGPPWSLVLPQASRLFDCRPVSWSVASGTRPPILGWSGTIARNWSREALKSSWLCLMLLSSFGRLLKSLAPLTWKPCSLRVCTAPRPPGSRRGTSTLLPSLSLVGASDTPQLGTRHFQNLPHVYAPIPLHSSFL